MIKYTKFRRIQHYTLPELYRQITQLKKYYNIVLKSLHRGRVELELMLQPTEFSISYKIKIIANKNSTIVNIFVIEPKIKKYRNGIKVPHLYNDGSLCLFYPKNDEWNYKQLWSETLIPWTSLWLFYYEIWIETGEWLGGGVHPSGGKK